MTKAGEAIHTPPVKDYCKCNAKFENNDPICKTDCRYNQFWMPIFFEGIIIDWYPVCNCIFIPCNGSPCQQEADYLSEIWNSFRDLRLFFIDFYTAMLQEPRSDIMKELEYSRQKINTCSVTSNTQGTEAILLNCTRAENEATSLYNAKWFSYNGQPGACYGGSVGKNFDLTDNWFCCNLYNPNPSTINPSENTSTR